MDNAILLADPASNAWQFAQKIQKYIKETKNAEFPLKEVFFLKFRNNEISVNIPENVRKKDVYFIHDPGKYPQDWWVQLMLIKDLLLSASANSVTFVLTNILYSRQDRKDKPHVPISARTFARSISHGLRRIITMDLHAGQIQGFYPEEVPVDNLYSFPEVVQHLRTNHLTDLDDIVIVSPDAGAAGRTKGFLRALEKAQENSYEKQKYSFALLSKERSKPGEIGEMQIVGDVKDKNVLIPDDLIDSGNTLCNAAKVLKANGAKKLLCYGTHGIFTNGFKELCSNFDVIMTSNTHPQTSDAIENSIEVIDMSPLFAEAIYRAHTGQSISELFQN